MKKRILIIAAMMVCLGLQAQQRIDLARFDGLKSEGEIPADLRKSLDQLYAEDKQRVRDYNDGKLRNRDKVMQQSYYITRLTTNGRILYGDPVTKMVERIADTLLKDYPELRKELRFYTVKSPSVNAFATGQGMIFVNLGLVAQSENEAQLAYVISHEIIHYYKNHNTEELVKKKSSYKDNKGDDELQVFLKRHNRSKEMEREADSLGLEMFYIPSPYDKNVTDGVFDVLQYAYLPFDEVTFDTTFFDSPYYKLNSTYFLSKVGDITARDDYDDSHSSHPNIKKRRAMVGEMLAGLRGGSKYVVTTREEYDALRDMSRMECIRQELIYADYARAFYDSYVMRRYMPDNIFLARAQSQSLYGLAVGKASTNTNDQVGDYKDYEGEIQQVYHMFGKMTANNLALVGMRQLWKNHLQFPNDPMLADQCRNMMRLMRNPLSFSKTNFAAEYVSEEAEAKAKTEETNTDKYAHIRQKKNSSSSTDQQRYAFTDFMMQDGSFGKMMEEVFAEDKAANEEQKTDEKKGTLLFAPYYLVVDARAEEMKVRESDIREEQLVQYVKNAAQEAGQEIVDFSDPMLRSHSDAQFYNDFVTINEWNTERYMGKKKTALRLFSQGAMDELAARLNVDKLTLNAVGNAENIQFLSPEIALIEIGLGVLMYPIFPIVALEVFGHTERTLTSNMVVDLTNGNVLSDRKSDYSLVDSRSRLSNDIYNAFVTATTSKKPAGYMGRRMVVSVAGAMDIPLFNELFERYPGKMVNFRPAIGLEFVTKDNQSLALWLDYNKTQYDVCGRNELAQAKVLDASLTYRFYIGQNQAPMGTYLGIGAIGSRLAISQLADPTKPMLNMDSTYYRYGVMMEYGRNYMIGKRLLLNVGTHTEIAICSPMEPFVSYDPVVLAERKLNAGYWVSNMFFVNLGLGFLPF